MLYYALAFLIIGFVAATVGTGGATAVATKISWGLFIAAGILLVVYW